MTEHPRPIGVFCQDFGGYYYGGMLSGIHQVARSAGVPLVVIQRALGDQMLPTFSADHVAGWIVIHPNESDRVNLATLCAAAIPVVMLPVPLEGLDCPLVQVDNRGGMCAAVLHLIDHGHQRIAYVDQGPYTWSQQRYQGYCDALAERGLAIDPALVIRMQDPTIDGTHVHHARGVHAAQYLLEHGLACTALAAGTDTCAIAAMQTFQAAGRCIPDDIAIVGFDDIIEAQYASPPLTTVRSSFDALGRAAAEYILTLISGDQAAQPQTISVTTTVLHRRSCGCTTLDELLAGESATLHDSTGWQTTLTQQLVRVVRYPLPLDPALPADQIWPGARVLVTALDAALQGQPPASAGIEAAWQQAITQTENIESLHAALTLLEDTAEQHLAGTPDVTTRSTVMLLLRRVRLELIRARLAYEVAPKQQLADQVRANYRVSMDLLGSNASEAQSLAWLNSTPATWGCLGLWDTEHSTRIPTLIIAGAYRWDTTPNRALGQQLPVTAFPPIDKLPISAQQGRDLTILCSIRTPTNDWGVLALCGWSDQLLTVGAENLTIQATLLGATLDRTSVLTTLTAQQATLQAAYDRERSLSETIHELGCPIIPLLPHVLLVPLIGALDSRRAQQIIGTVLMAITEHSAQTVFLDVTGVPIVDTQVASSLIQTAQAATLLGARVVMVGIRPEIAQSIVGLGIDLRHLTMYANLANAISALQIYRLPGLKSSQVRV